MKLKVKRLKNVSLPLRGSKGAAGWDLFSPGNFGLKPNELSIIPLGISLEIPENHFVSLVLRSSMGKKSIIIPNAMGIIDEDYRGELNLILLNLGKETISIQEGDRICQIILQKYSDIELEEVDTLSHTERNTSGIGSTGR